MGQHLLHVHRPAGVLLLLVPAHMLACNQIRCKNMRTYCDQTFFKCKPSLNMLSLCGACDAPTSPCACIASAASSCGHCKQQSHTKMIPAPIEGKGGGGQNQPFECLFLLLGNPGMMIHPTTSNISNGILTWHFLTSLWHYKLSLREACKRLLAIDIS